MERVEEPGQPLGDVQRPLLGPLQDVVVSLAFALDLRRQTVEALRAALGACQQQVADGPGDTAIAIVERVQRDEPQMAEPRFDQWWFVRWPVQPVEEAAGFGLQTLGVGRLEMHPLATDGSGHHLHRTTGIVAPAADLDLGKTGVAGRKQRGMPAEQSRLRDSCLAVGRGIQHHLDHALDVPIDRCKRADVHAQPAGDGRAHGFDVELLALDLAGLDHILGERRETGLIAQRHADIGQAAHQEPLSTTDLGHRSSQSCQVEAPGRPVAGLPDVFAITAIHAEIVGQILRMRNLFAAFYADKDGAIRRKRVPERVPGRCRAS